MKTLNSEGKAWGIILNQDPTLANKMMEILIDWYKQPKNQADYGIRFYYVTITGNWQYCGDMPLSNKSMTYKVEIPEYDKNGNQPCNNCLLKNACVDFIGGSGCDNNLVIPIS